MFVARALVRAAFTLVWTRFQLAMGLAKINNIWP